MSAQQPPRFGPPPFRRIDYHDNNLLVGARWWQEQIQVKADPVARRSAMVGLSALVAIAALGGGCVVCVAAVGSSGSSTSTPSPDDIVTDRRDSLDTQKQYGWSFGNESDPLDVSTDPNEMPASAFGELGPFDRTVLDRLATDLAPPNGTYRPFYVPTLFQALTAKPTTGAVSDDDPASLRDTLHLLSTKSMSEAWERGASLGSLMDGAPAGRAILIDLPGPESVAFAAGLSAYAEPVFTFDNWPHPRGVVPAERTLGAVAYYAQSMLRAAAARPKSPPAFVLDANRALAYSEASDRFDNRYMARVPTADNLKALGVKQVLYVRPRASDAELDDLNADFNAYREAGIDVKLVAAEEFTKAASAPETPIAPDGGALVAGDAGSTSRPRSSYYYGGSPTTHWWFWSHYGWGRPSRPMAPVAPRVSAASTYRPAPRPTTFVGVGPSKVRPTGFGQERIAVSKSSGLVVGSSRSGSWTRSSGWTSS